MLSAEAAQPAQTRPTSGRVLIRTVPWDEQRYEWARELQDCIPGSQLVLDDTRRAWDTMLKAVRAQGTDDAWHLEDDIVLTTRWSQQVDWIAGMRRGVPIQTYSDRKKDLEVGSRWEPGGTFISALCFFLPGELAPGLLEYAPSWPPMHPEHRSGMDLMVADYFKAIRQRYWLHVPSLVQHRRAPSVTHTKRTAVRFSRTFRP